MTASSVHKINAYGLGQKFFSIYECHQWDPYITISACMDVTKNAKRCLFVFFIFLVHRGKYWLKSGKYDTDLRDSYGMVYHSEVQPNALSHT